MPRGDWYAVPQAALSPHGEVQPLQHLRGRKREEQFSDCSAVQRSEAH